MKTWYLNVALLSWGLFFSSMREANCGMIRSLGGATFFSAIWPVAWAVVLFVDTSAPDGVDCRQPNDSP